MDPIIELFNKSKQELEAATTYDEVIAVCRVSFNSASE